MNSERQCLTLGLPSRPSSEGGVRTGVVARAHRPLAGDVGRGRRRRVGVRSRALSASVAAAAARRDAWGQPQGKGSVLATEAMEHKSHKGGGTHKPRRQWNTQGRGGVLATKAVEHTKQRR